MDALVALAASEIHELDCAFASLILYDHILCIGEEVRYFWTGSWSLSRFLYLSIRYLALAYAVFLFTTLKWTTGRFRESIILIKFIGFPFPISTLCQTVITLRIWFLFSRNRVVRVFSLALLFASTVASLLLFILLRDMIRSSILHPFARSSPTIALVYVPSLVLHTVLFALTVYRFCTSSEKIQTDSFLWRLLKEGMFMYGCASVSLLIGVVCSTMVEPSQIALRAPAEAGSPVLSLVAIAVCRAMLSIRSLAATSHVDPEWLLNHAELNRVHWRRGDVSGEIVVEAGESSIPLDVKYRSSEDCTFN